MLDRWERNLYLEISKGGFYYEPYAILLLTGMRIGEFSALQWSDIDFYKKEISIKKEPSFSVIEEDVVEGSSTSATNKEKEVLPFVINMLF